MSKPAPFRWKVKDSLECGAPAFLGRQLYGAEPGPGSGLDGRGICTDPLEGRRSETGSERGESGCDASTCCDGDGAPDSDGPGDSDAEFADALTERVAWIWDKARREAILRGRCEAAAVQIAEDALGFAADTEAGVFVRGVGAALSEVDAEVMYDGLRNAIRRRVKNFLSDHVPCCDSDLY